MAMLGILSVVTQTLNANLVASTESAKVLAEYIKLGGFESWIPITASVFSAIAAGLSFFAAKKSADMAHSIFINDLNKEYSSLGAKLFEEYSPELPLSNKNKKSMCNFFEKMCGLYTRKIINKGELFAYYADMSNQPFVGYALKVNKSKPLELRQYSQWLKKNDIS